MAEKKAEYGKAFELFVHNKKTIKVFAGDREPEAFLQTLMQRWERNELKKKVDMEKEVKAAEEVKTFQ